MLAGVVDRKAPPKPKTTIDRRNIQALTENAKSLAAHQRKCKNKTIDEVEVEDVTNSDDNKTKSPKSDKMKKHNKNDIEV